MDIKTNASLGEIIAGVILGFLFGGLLAGILGFLGAPLEHAATSEPTFWQAHLFPVLPFGFAILFGLFGSYLSRRIAMSNQPEKQKDLSKDLGVLFVIFSVLVVYIGMFFWTFHAL